LITAPLWLFGVLAHPASQRAELAKVDRKREKVAGGKTEQLEVLDSYKEFSHPGLSRKIPENPEKPGTVPGRERARKTKQSP
jgi:hypothetical protein